MTGLALQPEWLELTGPSQRNLHEQAAAAARQQFGNRVFVRGVLELSNYCRENCRYCGMRRENRSLERQRASWEALAELALRALPPSVTDLNLQSGEDPRAAREVALPLIRLLRRETALGMSVCLGTLSREIYEELQAAGASIYIMKFEIAQPALYKMMRAPGDFAERLDHIQWLADADWRVSSGFIAGLPSQTAADAAENIRLAASLPLDGCSVSPFIPGEETPLAGQPTGSIDWTLNSMAAMRLIRPDWVIPAVSALNLADPMAGYRRGLAAGANLATINLTPPDLRGNYLLYKRDRFIMTEERILRALDQAGLTPSRQSLADWFRSRPKPKPAPASEAACPAAAA